MAAVAPEPYHVTFQPYGLEGGIFLHVDVCRSGPGEGAGHFLPLFRRNLVQHQDEIVGHVIRGGAEFAPVAVEGKLAGERVVSEDGVSFLLHGHYVFLDERFYETVVHAAAEQQACERYDEHLSHFTVTSFMKTSWLPSSQYTSALSVPDFSSV